MSTPIRLKRSSVPGKRPTTSDLQLGELALNFYDGYLFAQRDTGGVGIGTTISLLTPWTENYGSESIYYQNSVGIGTALPQFKFHVVGISTFSEDVYVGRNVYIARNLKVEGTSEFIGVVTFRGGTINIGDQDTDDVVVGGEFASHLVPTLTDTYNLGSDTKRWSNLYVQSQVDINNINVSGLSTFASNVDINADLDVDGRTELDTTNISETLNVVGISTFGSDIDINASIDVDGRTELDTTNISETLNVVGISTFGSDVDINASLDVDGRTELDTTNISETLNVVGVATFVSDVDIDGGLDVDGVTQLDTTIVSETLGVIGQSSFNSNVNVNATINVQNDLIVDGISDLDELNVAGFSTFASDVDINANVDISGYLDVDGRTELDKVNISENLTVTGITTISGLLDANSGIEAKRVSIGTFRDNEIYTNAATLELTNGGPSKKVVINDNLGVVGVATVGNYAVIDEVRIGYDGPQTIDTVSGNLILKSGDGGSVVVSEGNFGISSPFPTSKLDVDGDARVTGVVTATRFSIGAEGYSINITNDSITGPSTIIIDPSAVGDNTGSVRIKGNLYVDGSQFIVDSSTIELKDFQVGIASDITTNVLLDGAGIGIGSTNIRKTLTYDYSSDSLKSSEHFDLAANKTYKINEVEVLRDTQLTIPNAYVSGLGTITQLSGTNLTYTNADIDTAYVTTGIVTTLQGTDVSYTNAYVNTGVVTTLSGTDVFYTNGNFGTADIDTAYVTTGIITTLSGTDVFYTNGNFGTADIDTAYVTTGIVTTLQGTDISYTNLYVNSGIVTNLVGTSMTYTNAEITNLTINSGVVTTISGTDLSYENLYAVAGIITTLAGTNLTYTTSDIDTAYVTTGIVTTLQGTDVSYTNAYVTTGIVTTLQGTDVSYTNAYVNTGVVTTLSGTDINYTGISTFGNVVVGGATTELVVGGDARITGILTVGSSSVTIDGDNNQIKVGTGVTIDSSGIRVSGVSSLTATTIYGHFDGELNSLGKTYYVSTTGSDLHTGDNINQPFRTIKHALSVAVNGEVVIVSAGVYEEICPLVVPRGVTLKGAGLRATTIRPTNATKTENVFHLNDISTVEDFTIRGSYYNSTNDTGYSFAYQPGIAITSRSPYVQRVTVLNTGSVVTSDDPYGYDSADSPPTSYIAGAGAKVDGSLVASNSLEAGMLFNEVTFFTPNNKGTVLTNGARAEYLNCFHYFASQAIVGVAGTVGISSSANARLKFTNPGVTPSVNDVVKLYQNTSIVAVGTITEYDAPYARIQGVGFGTFSEAVGVGSTQDVRFFQSDGVTQTGIASAISLADYTMFGAEMRSVGCAVEYGSQGVVADGVGVQLRLFAMNFNHVGSGKDFTNDKTLVVQSNEVVELDGGQVSYVSIDQGGDFRVGDSLYINQVTGNVSFAATSYDLEVLGNLEITDGVSNSTTITPVSLSVGVLQIASDTLSSSSGDININPAGSAETNIDGNLNVSGILTAAVIAVDAVQRGDTSIALDDTGSDGTIRFNTDSIEALRITNTQTIGINSTSPTATLDVNGTLKVSDTSTFIGTISAVDANFSGNVTIGGTLTYEDVSNVESIGIITALSGVNIISGGLNVVTGISTFNSDLDINANVDISGYLDVDGRTELDTTNISETLNVVGVSTFGSDVDINANVDISGYLDVDGRTELDTTNISETLNVVGISTFSSDIDINASIDVSGTTTTGQLNVTGVSTFQGNVDLGDNDRLRLGDSQDLQIYHDGSDSYILDNGTGELRLRGNVVKINNATNTETMFIATQDGAIDLYYDGSKKFETTAYGVNVTGTTDTDGLIVSGVTTTTGTLDANGDLDVDGRTELDTTNISETLNVVGVTTLSSDVGVGGTLSVSGSINSSVDVQINGTSILETAINDALALAIALG